MLATIPKAATLFLEHWHRGSVASSQVSDVKHRYICTFHAPRRCFLPPRYVLRVPALPWAIGEEYDHSGVVSGKGSVFHVESRGYEAITAVDFLNASERTVLLRFCGPAAPQITSQVAALARARAYTGVRGNPFSRAGDRRTQSCNELIHYLFERSVVWALQQAHQAKNDSLRGVLWKTFFSANGTFRPLGPTKRISGLWLRAAAPLAERAAALEIANPQQVEAKVEAWSEEACSLGSRSSWDYLITKLCNDTLPRRYAIDVLTPDTFVRSRWFHRVLQTGRNGSPVAS